MAALSLTHRLLADRRRQLGMSHAALAAQSGVSEPTVKRILGGKLAEASFENVRAVAEALGVTLAVQEIDVDELRRRQARGKAERLVRYVQGNSALEGQGVDDATRERLVERTYHELMAGSGRGLWGE